MQYSGTISTLMEQGKISSNFEGSNSLFVHLMKGLFFSETTTLLIQNIKQNREFDSFKTRRSILGSDGCDYK